jgi:hypothetical protein
MTNLLKVAKMVLSIDDDHESVSKTLEYAL